MGEAARRKHAAVEPISRETTPVLKPLCLRSIELFSGCGGLALGTARAGFHHELMVEWNNEAVATLATNKGLGVEHVRDWNLVHADVRDFNLTSIAHPYELDLLAGGPPCQPFSVCGLHKGKDDHRDMWPQAVRAVRELRPRGFLFENVRGLTRPAFAGYLAWILESLATPSVIRRENETHEEHTLRMRLPHNSPEYHVSVINVNAADHGAAQKRHRVIIAGVRANLGIKMSPPAPTHSRERLVWDKWVTGDYWNRHGRPSPTEPSPDPTERSLAESLRKIGKIPSGLAWRTVRDAITGLGEPNGHNQHVFQAGARVYQGHTGSSLDVPAKALKAGDHGVPGGENMMVKDNGSVRYFTVREAARLQGFPDNWSFATSWSENMRQIGNAVPVQLAEAMGKWMSHTLRSVSTVHS